MNNIEFSGISPQARLLLAENRFNNSREFYEQNKDKLKALATEPMRQLCSIVSDELLRLDEEIETNPVRMVSRIRRDTRYSKDKTLYRENMWAMFMRNKNTWSNQPCMWFEFYPSSYSYGVGTFRTDAAYWECFRKKLFDEPDRFRKAVKDALATGAVASLEGRYKKDKYTGFTDDLTDFANCRGMYFMFSSDKTEDLCDNTIAVKLLEAIKAFSAMYAYLLEVMQESIK